MEKPVIQEINKSIRQGSKSEKSMDYKLANKQKKTVWGGTQQSDSTGGYLFSSNNIMGAFCFGIEVSEGRERCNLPLDVAEQLQTQKSEAQRNQVPLELYRHPYYCSAHQ